MNNSIVGSCNQSSLATARNIVFDLCRSISGPFGTALLHRRMDSNLDYSTNSSFTNLSIQPIFGMYYSSSNNKGLGTLFSSSSPKPAIAERTFLS